MSDVLDIIRTLSLEKYEAIGLLAVACLLYAVYYLWRSGNSSRDAELAYLRQMVRDQIAEDDGHLTALVLNVEALKRIEARLERMELIGPRRGHE